MRGTIAAVLILGGSFVFVLLAGSYLYLADQCMDFDNLSPDCSPGRAR